jgi:hypothetical protein
MVTMLVMGVLSTAVFGAAIWFSLRVTRIRGRFGRD